MSVFELAFDALAAFLGEHQRCGAMSAGVNSGLAWFQCSCGALIVRPARPSEAARATTPPAERG